MAVDPNRQTLIQQLGEMRSTRMQQMRVGSQQTQMMGRQVQLTQSMSAALQNNTRQLSTLNTTMSSGFRNLSSSFASSMRGLTSAVSRGAVGAASAAGGAAAGVGRVSASAVSGVTSGIVSGLRLALPTAIAGVIGKSLIWDNIDDSTKKEMGENVSGIFKNVFGDSLSPVTKELKVMTMTLADTLESLSDKIGGIVSGLKGKVPSVSKAAESAKETASNISNKASDAVDKARDKIPRGVDVAGRMAGDVKDVAVKGYELAKGSEAPEIESVKTGAAVVGTAAAGYKTAKIAKESLQVAQGAEKAMGFKGTINQQAMALLKKDGSKVTKLSLLTARIIARITVAGGAAAAKVLSAIVKFKLDRAASVIGVVIQLVGLWYIIREIESMVDDKTITPEEGKELAAFAKKQAAYSGVGSLVVGGLGAAVGAGALSIPLGIGGSIGGSMLGSYVAEKTTKFSAGITAEIPEAKQESGMNLSSQLVNLKEKKGQKKNQAATVSKPSAGATSGGKDNKGENGSAQKAMDFFMSRGYTKEQAAGIVGNLKVESSNFSTIAVGDKDRKEGPSIGIAQWDPKRQGDFKRIFGKDIKEASFEEQLAFIDWELNNTEAAAGQKLRGAKTAEEAALMIDAFYERSAGSSTKGGGKGGAMLKQRQQAALAMMGGGSAQTTMMASTGAGASTDSSSAGLPTDQVSAAQKPTAGMNIKQKMDYFRDQLSGDEGNKPSATKGEAPQKPAGPFSGFASLIGGGSFESMKNELLAGLDSDMGRKAEATQAAPVIINNNGGDTNVTSGGGGGGSSAPVYNPIAPAASYQSQFTSIAGIQRTA